MKAERSVEMAAGIPINLDVTAKAVGSIQRDGVELTQTIRAVRTDDLHAGVRLYNHRDHELYVVVNPHRRFIGPAEASVTSYTIRRESDGTIHVATLRQLKQFTYLCAETPDGSSQGTG